MQINTQLQHKPFNYRPTTPTPLYSIAPGIDASDVYDYLNARLDHLHSLLMMTVGEGGESFRIYSDEIQDNFMWACAMLAEECRALFEQLGWRPAAAKPDDSKLTNVLERLAALHHDGAIVINPQAGKSQSDDAQGFLDWAGLQAKGGDQ